MANILSGKNAKSGLDAFLVGSCVADVADIISKSLQATGADDREFNCVDGDWDISITDEEEWKLLLKKGQSTGIWPHSQ